MKKIVFLLATLFLICACENDSETTSENDSEKKSEKIPKEKLVEVKDGVFTEWYPGKKSIKFQGGQDELGNRDGKWTFYAENGTELSFTLYNHGKKEGFSLVKYPNGRIHYRGEYQNDKMIGLWSTYDEKGKLISEKEYGDRK
jgi:antitoxin component YwqK of YwqJK toxin-antitoxin module